MKCLVHGCSREGRHSRGLCRACYKAAEYQVKKGVVSWGELEELGKVLRVGEARRRSMRFAYFADGMREGHVEARGLK